MKVNKAENPKRVPPGQSTRNSFLLIAIIAVAAIIISFFLWYQQHSTSLTDELGISKIPSSHGEGPQEPPPPMKVNTTPLPPVEPNRTEGIIPQAMEGTEPRPDTGINTSPQPTVPSISSEKNANSFAISIDGDPNKGNKELLATSCLVSTKIIRDFYLHLDQQEYMKGYGLLISSEEHFNQLIQKLIDNPPIVSGETNDLFTILHNTAHFFRIIGRENIQIIKAILDSEKLKFENVLGHFYSIVNTPTCPENNFSLRIPEDSLYAYAGFFLNTMGGRLYLFRRDSMSRVVVNFYSILLIDQANRSAKNKDGIEIKTAIDRLIADIETNSNQLNLEQFYLDTLYTLQERYQ